jgi:AcrR family transcriptional regulator
MPRTTDQLRGDRARAAILTVAGEQFLSDGLRATSVEAIAAAAGVSRPTVYAHFGSKDEIFREIVSQLYEKQFAEMQSAAKLDVTTDGRLYAVLEACFLPLVTLTASSGHGAELIDENSRVCGDITQAARWRALEVLASVLEDADFDLIAAGTTPGEVAALIYDAARGAKREDTVPPEEFKRQLGHLVSIFYRGLT